MQQSWMRNLGIFVLALAFLSSCKDHEYSKDEPLIPEQKAAVYIGSQNQFLYALDPTTGSKNWERNLYTNVDKEPFVMDGKVYVATNQGLFVLDAIDGTILDTADLAGLIPTSAPVGEGNYIYVGVTTDRLVKYNVKSAAIEWLAGGSGAIVTSVIIRKDLVIYAQGTGINAINKNNPSIIAWGASTGGTAAITNPIIEGTHLYVTSLDGKLYSFSVDDGSLLWTFNAGSPISSSTIAYGGNLIFGCDDGKLYCIDSTARAPRWTYNTLERIKTSPFAYNQVIYFGGYDHYVYAVNIIDGTLKWKYQTNGIIKASPLVHDGILYTGSYDRTFYAFDTSGQLKWSYDLYGPIDCAPVVYDLEKGYYPTISGASQY